MARTSVTDLDATLLEAFLALTPRPIDVAEWALASGAWLKDTLRDLKPQGRAFLVDGLPVCIWGATPSPCGRFGILWLAAAQEAMKHGKALHRHGRAELARMAAGREALVACSWAENTDHHSWLLALGFEATETQPIGPLNVPFTAFVRLGV